MFRSLAILRITPTAIFGCLLVQQVGGEAWRGLVDTLTCTDCTVTALTCTDAARARVSASTDRNTLGRSPMSALANRSTAAMVEAAGGSGAGGLGGVGGGLGGLGGGEGGGGGDGVGGGLGGGEGGGGEGKAGGGDGGGGDGRPGGGLGGDGGGGGCMQ